MFVPKVKVGDTTYVFLGDLPHDISDKIYNGKPLSQYEKNILEQGVGKKYESILGLGADVVYKRESVHTDDTVNIFRKKLVHYLNLETPNKLYIWFTKPINNDPSVIFKFVYNIFKKQQYIKYDLFVQTAKWMFGNFAPKHDVEYNMIDKKIATQILFEAAPKTIKESLCFSYTFDGFIEYFPIDPFSMHDDHTSGWSNIPVNNLSLLLYNFPAMDNTYHVVTFDKVDAKKQEIYFPFSTTAKYESKEEAQFLNNLIKLETEVAAVEIPEQTTKNIVNLVHIKGNETNVNSKVNLEDLFNQSLATHDIPFIKFKTTNNVFYKIHKKSLTKIDKDDLDKWTIIPKNKDDKIYIIFKVRYNSKTFASVIVNNDLSYHVKLSLSIKDQETVKNVEAFLVRLNDLVFTAIAKLYNNNFIPLIPTNVLYDSKAGDAVKVVQIITSSNTQIKSINPSFKIKQLKDIISNNMYPYFNIIDTKDTSVLHIQYKKVDNYTKFDNISTFIQFNHKLPRDELIHQIITTFLVSNTEAEKEIEAWFAQHSQDTNADTKAAMFRKDKNNNFINIKIRLSSLVDLKYITNGLTNLHVLQNIQNYILKLVVLSSKSSKATATNIIKQLETYDQKHVNEVVDNTNVSNMMNMNVNVKALLDEEEADDSDDFDIDMDLLALDKEFHDIEPEKQNVLPQADLVVQDATTTAPIKLKGYVLGKLYEADKNLFDYKAPAEKETKYYATQCGWVDRRQPVVVSDSELEKINKEFPDAVKSRVKSGSTAELEMKNNYICPRVWCPKSRVALSFDDYVKYGRKCPYPEIDEEPILFNKKTEGDAGLKRVMYPGFLDKYTHPDHYCLPCCFKKEPKKGNLTEKRKDMCVSHLNKESNAASNPKSKTNAEVAEVDETKQDKYVKGANYVPVEVNRFALLPPKLVAYLHQEGKQGIRHDGTGIMNENTNAFFRKGILQSDQSYLDAIVSVLDNPNIKSASDLIRVVIDNIDILTYISLENGRIMKMFIDSAQTVFDQVHFKAFFEWFKTQKKYIMKMNLERLLNEIESLEHIAFDKEGLLHHHEVLREFVIYQSFMNFKGYMSNERVVKEHIVLSDLLVNHLQDHININKYNIVTLEYNTESDKVFIHCNVNTNKKYNLDLPFVLLMRRNTYYEPLYHISHGIPKGQEKASLIMTPHVFINSSNKYMKSLLKFHIDNCFQGPKSKGGQGKDLYNLMNFVKGLGYKVKYVVIDYGYKTCGFILNHNIYLPLEHREDFLYDTDIHGASRYVYISDVPNFKCLLERSEIKGLYDKIKKFLNTDFYKIYSFIVDEKGSSPLGFVIDNGNVFVPLKVSASKHPKIKYTYKNGLFILVDFEDDDKRRQMYADFEKNSTTIERTSQAVKDAIDKDSNLKNQLTFILDKNNPLPIVYKKERLATLLRTSVSKVPKLSSRELYVLFNYLQDGKHYRLYQQLTRRFKSYDDELLLDHFDISSGKLKDAIEFAENPYKSLLNIVSHVEQKYIFETESLDEQEDHGRGLVNADTKYEDVPVKWRKILRPGWSVIVNTDTYHPKYVQHALKVDESVYYVSYRNKITESLTLHDEGETEIMENPCIKQYIKKNKLNGTIDEILEHQESIHFYPSLFDIKLMAQLANVNLVIIGRKTVKNPDGLEYVSNGSQNMVIVLYSYDRFKVIDKFQFFTYNGRIVFNMKDLQKEFKAFMEIIGKKMKVYEVEVDE
jgi:hypothetical protein